MILKVAAQLEINDVTIDQDDVISKLEKDLYDITEFIEENDDIINMTEIDVNQTSVDVSKTNDQNVFDLEISVDFDTNSSDFIDEDHFFEYGEFDEDSYYDALYEHEQDVYEVLKSEVDQFMSHLLGDYEDSNGNQFEVTGVEVRSIRVAPY